MMSKNRLTSVAVAVLMGALAWPAVASAHTETDLVASPAGEPATLSLRPTHGCGPSPTVAVTVRTPVLGATAGDVPGWTATAVEDEDGTVLEWTGGVLPAEETGDFPVTFTVPDSPGELLTFPALQQCEDGQELAWINGDPAAEYPAPRLLVLPAGSAPARSIGEVPVDAPGRDQLAEIVDVDNPDGPAPDAGDGGGVSGQPSSGAVGGEAGASDEDATSDDGAARGTEGGEAGTAGAEEAEVEAAAEADDDDGVSAAVLAVAIVAVVGIAGALLLRGVLQRRSQPPR